jgi:hypothetical protein
MATARKKPTTKIPTSAIPISFKDFAKKPVAGIAFICITGISYLYVDIKKTAQENAGNQNHRIDKLEYRDSLKTDIIMRLDSANASSNARFQMLESLNKLK